MPLSKPLSLWVKVKINISDRKIILLVFLVAILVYLPTLWSGFSPMDDKWIVLDNLKYMSDISNFPNLFSSSTMGMYYRPIWTSSLMLDMVNGNGSPMMFHVSNILFHAMCSILIFKLFLKLDISKLTAYACALLFAVHPVNVQAVDWIPGRNDTLLCLFSLVSIFYLVSYLQDRKTSSLILHFTGFCFALLTKENAIVLPFLFVGVSFCLKGTIKKSCFFILSASWISITLFWFVLRKNIVNFFPSFVGANIKGSILNFISAIGIYIGKCAIPFQQAIMPTLGNTSLIPGIVISLLIAFLLFKFSVKNKGLAFLGIIWFLLFIALPAWVGATNSNGEQYEHRIYTSLVGFLLFCSQINVQLNKKRAILVFLILLPLAFAAKTIYRCRVYESELSFAIAAASESPDVALLHNIEGLQYQKIKSYKKAIECFDKAIQLNTVKGEYYNNRGSCYFILKDYSRAIEDYTKTIELLSNNGDAYLNLSMAHYLSGHSDLAKNYLRQAMKLHAKGISQEYVSAVYGKN